MGFSEDQKRDFISELQHYLYVISYHDKSIPHIVSDGIYGPETAQAVKMFQHHNDIPPTGETDSKTWDSIVCSYKSFMAPEPLNVYYEGLVLSPDSSREIIFIVQVLLHALCEKYSNIPKPDINGVYTAKTQKTIDSFMDICGRKGKHDFDPAAWNMLAEEFNAEHSHKTK